MRGRFDGLPGDVESEARAGGSSSSLARSIGDLLGAVDDVARRRDAARGAALVAARALLCCRPRGISLSILTLLRTVEILREGWACSGSTDLSAGIPSEEAIDIALSGDADVVAGRIVGGACRRPTDGEPALVWDGFPCCDDSTGSGFTSAACSAAFAIAAIKAEEQVRHPGLIAA